MARGKRHDLFLAAARSNGTYEKLVAAHGSECCWVCARAPKKRRLSIDHSHSQMYVRGLLCFRCNRILEDGVTPKLLRDLADYLDAAEARYEGLIASKREVL